MYLYMHCSSATCLDIQRKENTIFTTQIKVRYFFLKTNKELNIVFLLCSNVLLLAICSTIVHIIRFSVIIISPSMQFFGVKEDPGVTILIFESDA